MTIDEIGTFLAHVALGDNRQIGAAHILDWEETLPDDMTFDEAITALRHHRRTSTDYLTQAHIINQVAADRAAIATIRMRYAAPPEIPYGLHQEQERAWIHAYWAAVKHGDPDAHSNADQALGIEREPDYPARLDRIEAIKQLATTKTITAGRP